MPAIVPATGVWKHKDKPIILAIKIDWQWEQI